MQPESNPSRKPLVAGIIAIAILVIIVGAVAMLGGKKDDIRSDNDTSLFETRSDEEITSNEPAGTAEGASYDSGTFTADGSYRSPGGTESIKVSVTLEGDIITDVDVMAKAASPTSKQYQGEFISGIADKVVGKNIDDINVSKVSGSSLTSKGFNQAIEQIKAEASS